MKVEILNDLDADRLWKLMPPLVHYKGDDYHFNAMRGTHREIVTYENDDGQSLFRTYRSDDTLSEALRGWLELLIDNNLLTVIQLERLISEL